jgi:hypothetical protein
MEVVCHTNLDLVKVAEKWPKELPVIPAVGNLILSANVWRTVDDDGVVREGQLELEVCRVVWKPSGHLWIPHIELHLPKGRFESIRSFYEWYGKITGRGVHAFI